MAVSLVVSETLDGTQIADGLTNGGSGTLLGQVTNGSFQPASGNARQDWFIRHTAVDDPCTDMKIHLQEYGVGTGYTYGGPAARSAAADYATLVAEGTASGSDKDNSDGLSAGIWMETNVLQMISATNQFDQATRPTEVFIFGDGGTTGVDLANAITFPTVAAVSDTDTTNGGDATNGYIPTAPVAGTLGISGTSHTTLGDNWHIGLRTYLRSAFAEGGVFQFELVIVFSYTS